jgi:hypothetical protein
MRSIIDRIVRLEDRRRHVSRLSHDRRRDLTDRAVLQGDPVTLRELCRHPRKGPELAPEHRAAVLSAAARADS